MAMVLVGLLQILKLFGCLTTLAEVKWEIRGMMTSYQCDFVKFCHFASSRVWQIHVVGTAPTVLLMKILHFFVVAAVASF